MPNVTFALKSLENAEMLFDVYRFRDLGRLDGFISSLLWDFHYFFPFRVIFTDELIHFHAFILAALNL